MFLRIYEEMKLEPYTVGTQVGVTIGFGGSGGGRVEVNTQRQEWRSYLVLFRQLISNDDAVSLAFLLKQTPRFVRDEKLKARLVAAGVALREAHKVQSIAQRLALGPYADPIRMRKLYLYGSGIFHYDDEQTGRWDALGDHLKQMIEYEIRMYEGRVRDCYVDCRNVLLEARDCGLLAVPEVRVNLSEREAVMRRASDDNWPPPSRFRPSK